MCHLIYNLFLSDFALRWSVSLAENGYRAGKSRKVVQKSRKEVRKVTQGQNAMFEWCNSPLNMTRLCSVPYVIGMSRRGSLTWLASADATIKPVRSAYTSKPHQHHKIHIVNFLAKPEGSTKTHNNEYIDIIVFAHLNNNSLRAPS